ncbi:MAG: F0F1 ATP synthase subunit delta [Patescibacteria group bacterium]
MNATVLNTLTNIKTKQDADRLDNELDLVLGSLFKSTQELQKVLEKSIDVTTCQALKKDYPEFGKNPLETRMVLENLKSSLRKVKVLKIYMAFEPTQKIIDKINNWAKENILQKVLLDFVKDESLLGGAAIEFDGLYRDFSLRKTLNEVFQNKKEEITSLLQ